jgi:predicted  nucleic acid-binding Zn-ribbon protein
MKLVATIKKQVGGKFDEKARLDLVTILANAGYTVGIEKVDGRCEYIVKIYEPGRS